MPRTATATKTTWEAKVPQLKPGKYADGMPLHQLHYLCCKLILRPNHFSSRASLFDFEKVLRAPAKRSGVVFTKGHAAQLPIQIREILFVDTHDFTEFDTDAPDVEFAISFAVPVEVELFSAIEKEARKHGVNVETLVNL